MSQTYVAATLRRLVRERAGEQCEYWLFPEEIALAPHWIDHIVAEKHGGLTVEENLALACVLCNQHKGSDLGSIDPLTMSLVPLFHPRRDRWPDHFQLAGGRIEPITLVGRATEKLLQLNHPHRLQERERLVKAGLLRMPGA
ncbi:MAG: HNH endonuclease [Gemmataceae bacterium]